MVAVDYFTKWGRGQSPLATITAKKIKDFCLQGHGVADMGSPHQLVSDNRKGQFNKKGNAGIFVRALGIKRSFDDVLSSSDITDRWMAINKNYQAYSES